MKVKRSGSSDAKGLPATASGGAARGGDVAFVGAIKKAQGKIIDGDLQEMLTAVRTLGDTFFRGPDEHRLEEYKDGIRQFLGRVSRELFSLRQETGVARDGQQKVFQMVETVRGDIDQLTRDTLQKDKALTLLASLDDIRGLVLDLIM
jgi:uncharacterized protein